MQNGHIVHGMADVRVRNIPEMVYRQLKSEAVLAGITFNEYLVQLFVEAAKKKEHGK